MQNEAKISCYQELYSKLKEEDALSDFDGHQKKSIWIFTLRQEVQI